MGFVAGGVPELDLLASSFILSYERKFHYVISCLDLLASRFIPSYDSLTCKLENLSSYTTR